MPTTRDNLFRCVYMAPFFRIFPCHLSFSTNASAFTNMPFVSLSHKPLCKHDKCPPMRAEYCSIWTIDSVPLCPTVPPVTSVDRPYSFVPPFTPRAPVTSRPPWLQARPAVPDKPTSSTTARTSTTSTESTTASTTSTTSQPVSRQTSPGEITIKENISIQQKIFQPPGSGPPLFPGPFPSLVPSAPG